MRTNSICLILESEKDEGPVKKKKKKKLKIKAEKENRAEKTSEGGRESNWSLFFDFEWGGGASGRVKGALGC